MSLSFSPLLSSSAGNCSFFGTERTKFLVDAGATGGAIEKALAEIGPSFRRFSLRMNISIISGAQGF